MTMPRSYSRSEADFPRVLLGPFWATTNQSQTSLDVHWEDRENPNAP